MQRLHCDWNLGDGVIISFYSHSFLQKEKLDGPMQPYTVYPLYTVYGIRLHITPKSADNGYRLQTTEQYCEDILPTRASTTSQKNKLKCHSIYY